jgi:hypothetical protein
MHEDRVQNLIFTMSDSPNTSLSSSLLQLLQIQLLVQCFLSHWMLTPLSRITAQKPGRLLGYLPVPVLSSGNVCQLMWWGLLQYGSVMHFPLSPPLSSCLNHTPFWHFYSNSTHCAFPSLSNSIPRALQNTYSTTFHPNMSPLHNFHSPLAITSSHMDTLLASFASCSIFLQRLYILFPSGCSSLTSASHLK